MFKTKSEEEFYSLFETENKRPATDYEDKFLHFDMIIDDIKIDVKGLKKRNRGDKHVNPDIHWVEIVNVRGNDGWLYGEADKIAFETVEGYLVVNRSDLRDFCLRKVVDKKPINRKELYRLYRRTEPISKDDVRDICILVLTKDLFDELPYTFISKK